MHQELAGIVSLQIPTGAGPNDPAIVIGATIPPELIAFYGGNIQGVEIFRSAAGTYTYTGITPFGKVEGSVTGGVVSELFAETASVPGTTFVSYGSFGQYDLQFNGPTSGVFFGNSFVGIAAITDFSIDGVSAARGFIDRVSGNTNSAGAVAETTVLTGNSVLFRNGRAFEVIVSADVLPLTAAGSCLLFVRRNSVAGTLLAITSHPLSSTTAASHVHWRFVIVNNSGADINDNLIHSLASGTANQVREQGAPTQLRYMEIRDCGAVSQYLDCPQL
jgi:hypothetical protein